MDRVRQVDNRLITPVAKARMTRSPVAHGRKVENAGTVTSKSLATEYSAKEMPKFTEQSSLDLAWSCPYDFLHFIWGKTSSGTSIPCNSMPDEMRAVTSSLQQILRQSYFPRAVLYSQIHDNMFCDGMIQVWICIMRTHVSTQDMLEHRSYSAV